MKNKYDDDVIFLKTRKKNNGNSDFSKKDFLFKKSKKRNKIVNSFKRGFYSEG